MMRSPLHTIISGIGFNSVLRFVDDTRSFSVTGGGGFIFTGLRPGTVISKSALPIVVVWLKSMYSTRVGHTQEEK